MNRPERKCPRAGRAPWTADPKKSNGTMQVSGARSCHKVRYAHAMVIAGRGTPRWLPPDRAPGQAHGVGPRPRAVHDPSWGAGCRALRVPVCSTRPGVAGPISPEPTSACPPSFGTWSRPRPRPLDDVRGTAAYRRQRPPRGSLVARRGPGLARVPGTKGPPDARASSMVNGPPRAPAEARDWASFPLLTFLREGSWPAPRASQKRPASRAKCGFFRARSCSRARLRLRCLGARRAPCADPRRGGVRKKPSNFAGPRTRKTLHPLQQPSSDAGSPLASASFRTPGLHRRGAWPLARGKNPRARTDGRDPRGLVRATSAAATGYGKILEARAHSAARRSWMSLVGVASCLALRRARARIRGVPIAWRSWDAEVLLDAGDGAFPGAPRW